MDWANVGRPGLGMACFMVGLGWRGPTRGCGMVSMTRPFATWTRHEQFGKCSLFDLVRDQSDCVFIQEEKTFAPPKGYTQHISSIIGYLLLRMSMRKSSRGKSLTRGWRQRAAGHGIKTVDAGGERPDIVWGQHKREVKTTIVILGRREVPVKPERFFLPYPW